MEDRVTAPRATWNNALTALTALTALRGHLPDGLDR